MSGMNVASLDLCRKLLELSGWRDTYLDWIENPDELYHPRAIRNPINDGATVIYGQGDKFTPAYDIGYLLRKLPFFHEYWSGGNEAGYLTIKRWAVQYEAGYWEENGSRNPDNKLTSGYADTPEDAACKLAIELFKQGVLKHED